MKAAMSTIFGPVPSRRLGRSLGIDVIPAKTCSYDCLYCESGRTTALTLERQPFVPPEQVMWELHRFFAEQPGGADVLTLSSAGEPTLYSALGQLLTMVKKDFPELPLVVLTNGSLLWHPSVRRDLQAADRVIPSLDAVTPRVFQHINRPCAGLEIQQVLEGLYAFRRDYGGQFHLEILLVSRVNDHPEELRELAKVARRLNPDRIELNTVARPPAFRGVMGLNANAMKSACSFFPPSKTQIIGAFRGDCEAGTASNLELRILELVERRPCVPLEMAQALGVSESDVRQALQALLDARSLKEFRHGEELFYISGDRA